MSKSTTEALDALPAGLRQMIGAAEGLCSCNIAHAFGSRCEECGQYAMEPKWREINGWIEANRPVKCKTVGVELYLMLLWNDLDEGKDGFTGKAIPKYISGPVSSEDMSGVRGYVLAVAAVNDDDE